MSEGTVRQWRRMLKDGRRSDQDKAAGHQQWVILFNVLNKEFVKDGSSQFQNYLVSFHKFHSLFSTRLWQLGWAITSSAQDRFRNCSWVRIKLREWLRLL
jgi:hypothetical protein